MSDQGSVAAAGDLGELRTARLRAEPLAPAHVDFLAALWQDPLVVATLGGARPPEEVRARVVADLAHWELHGFGSWVWFHAESGEPIGRSFLHCTDLQGEPVVELGYAVGRPDRWGQGLATEMAEGTLMVADGPLALADVVAFTLPTNFGSRRVMEKTGFIFAGHIVHASLPHVLYRRGPGASAAGRTDPQASGPTSAPLPCT